MIKVLFICHGNICRSPIAEFVMKDLVAKAGRSDAFEIASAATSREELGNPVLSARAAETGGARYFLCGQNCPPDDPAGL